MARGKSHHVVPAPEGGWNVRRSGSALASGRFQTKIEAVDAAREISRNHGAELFIHGQNAQIQARDSHGNPELYTLPSVNTSQKLHGSRRSMSWTCACDMRHRTLAAVSWMVLRARTGLLPGDLDRGKPAKLARRSISLWAAHQQSAHMAGLERQLPAVVGTLGENENTAMKGEPAAVQGARRMPQRGGLSWKARTK